MAISMVTSVQEERLRWILPIAEGRIRLKEVVKVCSYGKRTLERWVAAGGE